MLSFLSMNSDKFYLTDVWWDEPNIKVNPPENCVVTPHIGGNGGEYRNEAFARAFRSVKSFLEGKESIESWSTIFALAMLTMHCPLNLLRIEGDELQDTYGSSGKSHPDYFERKGYYCSVQDWNREDRRSNKA